LPESLGNTLTSVPWMASSRSVPQATDFSMASTSWRRARVG
jgi:hypothetical protein